MDLSVLYKRAQRWLHGVARPAILGNGILERARAMSLGLLGLTAAVGLAIVALAANQGWPLVAGSSIPRIPPAHQGVGRATVVVTAEATGAEAASSGGTARKTGDVASSESDRSPTGASPIAAPEPAEPSGLVVAPSAPSKPVGSPSHGGSQPSPPPAAENPKQGSTTPAAQLEPTPPRPPAEPGPPTATPSEAPSESYVPSWSNGQGHAYGRSSSESAAHGDEPQGHDD
jgi:hypothetical protein